MTVGGSRSGASTISDDCLVRVHLRPLYGMRGCPRFDLTCGLIRIAVTDERLNWTRGARHQRPVSDDPLDRLGRKSTSEMDAAGMGFRTTLLARGTAKAIPIIKGRPSPARPVPLGGRNKKFRAKMQAVLAQLDVSALRADHAAISDSEL